MERLTIINILPSLAWTECPMDHTITFQCHETLISILSSSCFLPRCTWYFTKVADMLGSLWTVKSITCPSLNSLHVYPIGLLKEISFSIEYLLVFLARQLQISGKVTFGKRDEFLHQFNIDAGSG